MERGVHVNGVNEGLELADVSTRRELAAALKISEASLARWAYVGGGPRFVKLGGVVRYMKADVLEWLASRRTSEDG